MSAISSLLIGGLLLLLLMASYVQLSLMIRDEALIINDLQKSINHREARIFTLSDLTLLNYTMRLKITLRGSGLSMHEFRSSDFFVACMDANNNSRILPSRYGDEWRVLGVSLGGQAEVLNPSSPELMTGWIDPGEEVDVEVRIPDECLASQQVSVIFVSPSGEVGVISGRGGG